MLLEMEKCDLRIRPLGATSTRPRTSEGKYDVKSAAMAPPREYPTMVKVDQWMGDDWRASKIWVVKRLES
jgi:hypothetical protein